jgi:hypothetical protein
VHEAAFDGRKAAEPTPELCPQPAKLTPHPRRICWPIDKTLLRLIGKLKEILTLILSSLGVVSG